MLASLYDPAEHRPLDAAPWSDEAARAAIAAIATDAIGAYTGTERLWPNRLSDLEGDPDEPVRNAYFGAAGVAWALQVLAHDGLAPDLPGLAQLATAMVADYDRHPELTHLLGPDDPTPPPSLLFGESGVRLAAEAVLGDGSQLDALHAAVLRNERNPTTELCWGSPSTMAAALELWRVTGEERWRSGWRDSAERLIDAWSEAVWVQSLYGESSRYVGAGHGFAGTAWSLLAGRDLLDDDTARALTDRVRDALLALVTEDGDLAQWRPLADREVARRPVQWCHGAPGIITSAVSLPRGEAIDRVLCGGGELTWRAGPLRKGPGLCHGTAGNGYALLALHRRTGEPRWLERARAFAMDAAGDVERRRAVGGQGHYTLWTGDLGVAMFLRGCLTQDSRFPWLEGALTMAGHPAAGGD